MKKLTPLFVLALACASFAFAADTAKPETKEAPAKEATHKFKAGGCCDKAEKAGKKCSHACCEKAEKDGKVCEKCNPPAKK